MKDTNVVSSSEEGSSSESEAGCCDQATEKGSLALGLSSWLCCSVGMLVFNKLAIKAFPVSCTLVFFQFFFTVLVMVVGCYSSIHIGSMRDVLRWAMVVPFFTGMILTSILALKYAPMTLVITFRALSPVISLLAERFYPNPIRVSWGMMASLLGMLVGVVFYLWGQDETSYQGMWWAVLNNFLAVGDRLLQRLMLGADQAPVDISKTGVTFLNNFLGCIPLFVAAYFTNEFEQVPDAFSALTTLGWVWLIMSCFVGVGISYTGIWVQSLITATSFLVLVNANKFFIIFLEAFVMGEKTLGTTQIIGAIISIMAGIAYGKAREMVETEEKAASHREVMAAAEEEELEAPKPLLKGK